jgi:multicomponent Na+:H+ antiporter subunit A
VDHASLPLDAASGAHLKLWHGVNTALVLSLLTLASGAALFWARGTVAEVQERLAPRFTGVDGYEASVRGVLRFAANTTSVAQPGSLPIYAAVILGTAALTPTVAVLTGEWWSGWPSFIGRAGHLPVAFLLVVGAVAATLATRRFTAVILLGVVGYGMAVLFVVQGDPDLALTQFAVETLSVVVFLLVLRRLPDRFERSTTPAVSTGARIAVSAAVGVFVVVMALSSSGARTEAPVSREMSEQAYPEGYGKNVVNVILVDIRGIDTLGEITVLVAAGIGITALGRSGRVPRPRAGRGPRTEVEA